MAKPRHTEPLAGSEEVSHLLRWSLSGPESSDIWEAPCRDQRQQVGVGQGIWRERDWGMPALLRLLHKKRAARYWIGTARLSGYSSRLRADSGNVLCRRAFLTLDDVKLNLLTLAE